MSAASDIRAAIALGHDLDAQLPALSVAGRLTALQSALRDAVEADGQADALLVTHLTNIRYLTGFTGSAARLFVPTDGPSVLVTDARYDERARDELAAAGCDAAIEVRRTVALQHDLIAELIASAAARRVALEADHVTWSAKRAYAERFDRVELVALSGTVESLRRTKDDAELARLARASAIADAAFVDVLHLLAASLTERAFASALDAAVVARGAQGPSFDTIIASGPNASRPHHEPGARVIAEGDEVICDFGALVDGYHSDMTRTVYVGDPSMAQRRHFAVVLASHDAGIAALKPGISGADADRACRDVIDAVGWGEAFVHGTGHGSGLDIHEEPWLGSASTSQLQVRDIATIEPGVYLPGVGGVRIEDSLALTDDGPVPLTRAPYSLVV